MAIQSQAHQIDCGTDETKDSALTVRMSDAHFQDSGKQLRSLLLYSPLPNRLGEIRDRHLHPILQNMMTILSRW